MRALAKSYVIFVKTAVNLMLCCIKHIASAFGTKALRLSKCRLIISLIKIAYYMWYNHTFSQINKATKKVGEGEGKRVGNKNEKWGLTIKRFFIKIGGLGTISHPCYVKGILVYYIMVYISIIGALSTIKSRDSSF